MATDALPTGLFRSPHDACIRRVFWHGRPPRLYAARTRPGQSEEEPYELLPAYLTRLLAFGCWHKQDER